MSLAGGLTVNRRACKAAGVFYTPRHIVEYILTRTLAKHDVVDNPLPRVLDPSCGTGNFLVAAYDLLFALFMEKLPALRAKYGKLQYLINVGLSQHFIGGSEYWRQENLHYHIIRHCLYGADIDKDAVSQAQQRLQEKGEAFSLSPEITNLLVCDSLIKWENNQTEKDTCSKGGNLCLADFWRQQYDYVVGNPPYVSFGLKRVGKVTAEHADYLRANYPRSAQYKLSYYALFFERGLSVLAPGGYLGYITPDSYLLGRYYSKIREFILETCAIEELTLVNNPVFADVVVGIPVITILQKNCLSQIDGAALVTVKNIKEETIKIHQYPQNYFGQQSYSRFRLLFTEEDKSIIDKLEISPCRFGNVLKIRTGMRSLTVQSNIKSKTKHGETWQPGLVSSAQVLPFGLLYQGDWLDVNPDKLNKGGWDKAVIHGPKIFLRQTGDKLIAALDRNGYYHLNNIHSITIIQGDLNLEYFVAILNSRLMNYYYQTVTLEQGRTMAQVDIEMVEKLPLVIDQQRAGKLIMLSQKISELTECTVNKQRKLLYCELNKVVYAIYKLTAREIEYIEQISNMHPSLS